MGGSYEQAVAALESALTFGIHSSLEGIRALTRAMGEPHRAFASVQVGGTNGKSSVARMTAALLSAHGLRTGTYTSPDLGRYTQRIEIDGCEITDEAFVDAVDAALAAAADAAASGYSDPFTEFELLTAATLWAFRAAHVDLAVLEVGMGGRWDATSVVTPTVATITGVAMDHAQHLGSTREAIAAEKTQIISAGSIPVLGPGTVGVEDVFLAHAESVGEISRAVRQAGEPAVVADEFMTRFSIVSRPQAPDGTTVIDVSSASGVYAPIGLSAPAFQAANAATAIATAEAALGRGLDGACVRETLGSMSFPGRFEIVADEPFIVVDGAHNPDAAAVLAGAVEDAWPDRAWRPVVVLGVLADKDAGGIVEALSPIAADFVCVAPASPRALDANALAEIVHQVTGSAARIATDVASGVSLASREGRDVLVTGSLTTVAEARLSFRGSRA